MDEDPFSRWTSFRILRKSVQATTVEWSALRFNLNWTQLELNTFVISASHFPFSLSFLMLFSLPECSSFPFFLPLSIKILSYFQGSAKISTPPWNHSRLPVVFPDPAFLAVRDSLFLHVVSTACEVHFTFADISEPLLPNAAFPWKLRQYLVYLLIPWRTQNSMALSRNSACVVGLTRTWASEHSGGVEGKAPGTNGLEPLTCVFSTPRRSPTYNPSPGWSCQGATVGRLVYLTSPLSLWI